MREKTIEERVVHGIALKFATSIDVLTDEELDIAINGYSKLSETNCSWIEFGLKQAVIENAIHVKKLRGKKKLKNDKTDSENDREEEG